MDISYLDTTCGFCFGQGRRDISGGTWVTAPACPVCEGIGYVVTEDGAHLLVFLARHFKAALHRELGPVPQRAAPGQALARHW